ncbi:UNVERIFIED_CONTAM: hypothetical protein K2H54_053643 [Gekko kuhli]
MRSSGSLQGPVLVTLAESLPEQSSLRRPPSGQGVPRHLKAGSQVTKAERLERADPGWFQRDGHESRPPFSSFPACVLCCPDQLFAGL